jgi:hypothetical protein
LTASSSMYLSMGACLLTKRIVSPSRGLNSSV